MSKKLTLYSDFNCPFCYVLNERINQLGLSKYLDWVGVQHAPFLPFPLDTSNKQQQLELAKEISMVRKLAPNIPISQPEGKPNTLIAMHLIAYVKTFDIGKAEHIKNALYRAYWIDLLDISSPEILEKFANDIEIQTIDITDDHKHTVNKWQKSWASSNIQCVPAIQNQNGKLLLGLTGIEELNTFISHA